MSTSEKKEPVNQKMEELKDNWEPIYRFPKIRGISAVNKLKNYQIGVSAFAVPVSFFFFPNDLLTVSYSSFALVLSLSLASYLLKNSVGFIYVHKKDQNLVRFAYLDFWGRRKDSEFTVDEIKPFSELPKTFTDKFYTTLKFNNNHEDLKLISKNVEILNVDSFVRIFGEE